MTVAMFRAMFLSLLNDRGALAMAFLLPIIFFLVLAEIFSDTTAGDMQVRVAVANEMADEESQRLLKALRASEAVEFIGDKELDPKHARGALARARDPARQPGHFPRNGGGLRRLRRFRARVDSCQARLYDAGAQTGGLGMSHDTYTGEGAIWVDTDHNLE